LPHGFRIHQTLIKGYDVILIDFKRGVSFSEFSDYVEIHFEYKSTLQVLKAMVEETKKRLDLFRENKVDNVGDYNRLVNEAMRRKIIFIDELAELLKTRDKAISNLLYDSLETLTRLSRSVGIHLIMEIQRPDSTIVTGQIKNNVSFRICGRFVDKEPSRIMLCCDRASTLKNIKGRFIIKDNDLEEIQCFYYSGGNSCHYRFPIRLELDNIPSDTKGTEEINRAEKVTSKSAEIIPDIEFDFSDLKNQ
jgi:S-DNA-T family DNA segregation ATPase FtsK/SpoIIIE